jgi:hypothetical protein
VSSTSPYLLKPTLLLLDSIRSLSTSEQGHTRSNKVLARFGQIILTIGSDTDRTHAINVNNSVFTQLESVVLRPCTFVIHDELSHLRTDIRKWTACVGVTRSLHVWKSSSAPFADSQHSPAWWAKAHRVAKAGPVQYLHLVDPSRGSQRTVHHYHAAIDVKLKAFPQSHPPNARPLSGMPRPVSIAASFVPGSCYH